MSQLKIKVINVEVTSTEKYKMAEVTFKNLDFDKTESRKIPSFKNPEVFNTLAASKSGDTFTVETVKDGQYWQWTKITAGTTGSVSTASNATGTPVAGSSGFIRNTYETPEERAKKQVYITRLSALSTAVAALGVGGKAALKSSDVVKEARAYEAYVFGNDPVKALTDMPDDLPAPVSLD